MKCERVLVYKKGLQETNVVICGAGGFVGPIVLFDELKKALAERVLNAELEDHLDGHAAAGKANHRNDDGPTSSRGDAQGPSDEISATRLYHPVTGALAVCVSAVATPGTA